MKKVFNKRNIVICVLVLLVLALSIETYRFVKVNTKIIMWDYQIARDAFSVACDRMDEGKMTDAEIALELGDQAFKPIWQTKDLAKPLLINSNLYSHNLQDFLFECTAAKDLSDKEVHALINKMGAVSEELNKVKWEDIWTIESWIAQRHAILETIENVDKILDEQ